MKKLGFAFLVGLFLFSLGNIHKAESTINNKPGNIITLAAH